ncbi:MAG: hypothetical protein H6741_30610 [Alphaproteobacteria bacterium]|nr:hypothetical protein [Alphaproteobacteria bacterium]
MSQTLQALRFRPSRCEGAPGAVQEVRVDGEALELMGPEGRWRFALQDMGTRRLLRRSQLIGERDWFRAPAERFVRFYTAPPITVYMPETDTLRGETFRELVQTLHGLGYVTHDLG